MRNILRRGMAAGGVLAAGMVCGIIIVSLMSVRASRLYVQMIRLSFAAEETQRAREALGRGDLSAASRHAACGIEAEANTSTFDPLNTMWTVSFPLTGAWVTERTRYPVADRSNLAALAHARLGVVLNDRSRSGNSDRDPQ